MRISLKWPWQVLDAFIWCAGGFTALGWGCYFALHPGGPPFLELVMVICIVLAILSTFIIACVTWE